MRFPAIELSQVRDRRKRVALSFQSGSPTRQARGGPEVAESERSSRQSGSPTSKLVGSHPQPSIHVAAPTTDH